MEDTFNPTKKSRRCYHRVMSGLERGGQMRFLTLTSSNESPHTCQRSFRILYMRLKRRGLIKGYIKVPEPSKNGKQHLHVLFRGSYIEQQLLSRWWQDIHHAKVVGITRVSKRRGKKGLAAYMAKYMSKDNFYRYSWSWEWVWRGFCKDWADLKKRFRQLEPFFNNLTFTYLIKVWAWCLRNDFHPPMNFLPDPV